MFLFNHRLPRRPSAPRRRDLRVPCSVLWVACAILPVAGLWAPALTQAQSLRDAVREHVDEGIDRSRQRKRRKQDRRPAPPETESETAPNGTPKVAPPEPEPSKAEPPKPGSTPEPTEPSQPGTAPSDDADGVRFTIGDGVEGEEGEPPPKLPHRFFPDYFRMDVKLGGGYRGWVPQQYDRVAVDVGHYFTWSINVKAKIFKFLALREGYYETNALSAPRTEEAAVLANAGKHIPKAAWLLGTLGFPVLKVWAPLIRYESRAFRTRATPQGDVCIWPRRGGPTDLEMCERTNEDLDIVSGFQTLVLGVRYNQSKDPGVVIEDKAQKGKLPPLFFGVGLMSYEKPYQVVIDGATLDEVLFDARFRGAGLAFGTQIGGGLNRFSFRFDVQAGLGEVKLTDDLTLNEVIPPDWIVGYVQGNAHVAISIPLWKFPPTVMFQPSGTFGGAAFYLIDTKIEDGESTTTPNVNWDFLWSAQANLVLSI